jgi:uncharacterized protein YggE
MRVWFFLMVAAAAVAMCGAAQADLAQGEVTTIGHPVLSVSGSGTVEVDPDTVLVAASITTEGESVAEARERNAQIAKRAMQAVEALKLKNVRTKTLNYTMERVTRDAEAKLKVDPSKQYIPWKTTVSDVQESNFTIQFPVTLGYRAAKSLTVRIEGLPRDELSAGTGKIIDALMEAGCNQISKVSYSLEKDHEGAMREALVKAVKDAQATAEVVAAAAGRRIVGIRSIRPSYETRDEARNVMYAFADVAAKPMRERAPTLVSIGVLEISAQVDIQYELDYNPGDTQFLKAPAD